MGVLNTAPITDVRKVMSGKDGGLFDGDGNLLVSVENFQSQVSINNGTFQPLGDAQEHATMLSYRVTLTFTEIVVEDSRFFQMLMDGLANHRMPVMNFRGMVRSPYNDSEEQMVYRDCVPDGTIDLQNLTVGELYKRSWNWIVNQPPALQDLLKN